MVDEAVEKAGFAGARGAEKDDFRKVVVGGGEFDTGGGKGGGV